MSAMKQKNHRMYLGKLCKTPGCTHKPRAKGYCINCYNRRYVSEHPTKRKANSTEK